MMTGQLNSQKAVRDCLFGAPGKVYVLGHPHPDGDSLGSIVGLSLVLQARGVEAIPVSSGPMPARYEFLTQHVSFAPAPVDATGATVAVLDCGDLMRLQELGQTLTGALTVVNIDHHQGNPRFGNLNLVDPSAAATGLLIWEVFGEGLNAQAAQALFTAIYTDTGRFSYPNTDARALQAAASLVELGANPSQVFQAIYETLSPNYLKFLGHILTKIEYAHNLQIALLALSQEELQESGLEEGELDSIIDYPRAVGGIVAAAVLKEISSTQVRVSFRSKGQVNVAKVAAALGGGGHINAAGASFTGSLAAAREQVLTLLSRAMEE